MLIEIMTFTICRKQPHSFKHIVNTFTEKLQNPLVAFLHFNRDDVSPFQLC